MARKAPKGAKEAEMARKRRSANDPETRNEIELTRKAAPESSSEESEESDTETKKSRSSSKTTATPKPRKESAKPKKSPPGTAVSSSSRSVASDCDDGVSLQDDVSESSSPPKSSSSKRRSASSAQEIADLKSKFKSAMGKKTAKERQLEKEKDALLAQLAAVQAEKDAAETKLEGERESKKTLKQKYRGALAQVGAKKSSSMKKNDGMIMQIKKVVKKKLWRKVKFIGNDKQLHRASDMVLGMMHLKDLAVNDDDSEAVQEEKDARAEEWLALYSTDVRAAINDIRSYTQSEQKKIALTWLKEGKPLLPFNEFKDIAMRNIHGSDGEEDPAKVEQFDLYVMMVSAVAGSAVYGEKARRMFPISTCKVGDLLAVPPGTEAMALVMYDNCYQKWINMHQRKEVDKVPGNIPKYSSKRHEETKMWMGKYSDSCSGNSPYGGWGKEGITQFNKLKEEIRTLRENHSQAILDVEMDAVKRFADAYTAERKRKLEANGKTVPDDFDEAVVNGKKRKVDEEEILAEFDDDEE